MKIALVSIASAICSMTMLAASPSFAAEIFQADWQAVLDTATLKGRAKPVLISRGGTFATVLIVPRKLWVVKQDVLTREGALLVPKGSQLVGMASQNLIACTFTQSKNREARSRKTRICFLDEDRDGQLDRYFEISDGNGTFLAFQYDFEDWEFYGSVDPAAVSVNEIEIEAIDVMNFDGNLPMIVSFDGFSDRNHRSYFRITMPGRAKFTTLGCTSGYLPIQIQGAQRRIEPPCRLPFFDVAISDRVGGKALISIMPTDRQVSVRLDYQERASVGGSYNSSVAISFVDE